MLLIKMRERLAKEEGFTLIELLVVLVIIAVLLAIAVPSYLGFKDRAEKRAAASNVRAALPSVEAYYSDQSPNSYNGMTLATLQAIDAGISLDTTGGAGAPVNVTAGGAGFCISNKEGNYQYKYDGTSAATRQNGVTVGNC
jgi:type IV pilus assembly protein PilA